MACTGIISEGVTFTHKPGEWSECMDIDGDGKQYKFQCQKATKWKGKVCEGYQGNGKGEMKTTTICSGDCGFTEAAGPGPQTGADEVKKSSATKSVVIIAMALSFLMTMMP